MKKHYMTICIMFCLLYPGKMYCQKSNPVKSKKQKFLISYEANKATPKQEKEIRQLIEQLVYAKREAKKEPIITPGLIDDNEKTKKRHERCQQAFDKLTKFKDSAFPIMLKHLKDKRQSIPFRNHYVGFSVGHACYWNIYFQLQDMPDDYSFYGYQRKGKDGKGHPKPYYKGMPFDEAGGLEKWLEKYKHLSYPEMQVKCLNWLLAKEKAIGASDPESYFVNILPLEIRILERKLEAGQNVKRELKRLKRIKKEKLVKEIPPELLPENKSKKKTIKEKSKNKNMRKEFIRLKHYLQEEPNLKFYVASIENGKRCWHKLDDKSNINLEQIKAFLVAYPSGEVLDGFNLKPPFPKDVFFMEGPDYNDDTPGFSKKKVDNTKVKITHGVSHRHKGQPNYYSTSIKNLTNKRIRVYKFAPVNKKNIFTYSKVSAYYSPRQFREWYRVKNNEGWINSGETVADPDNWGKGNGVWAYFFEEEYGETFIGTISLNGRMGMTNQK